MANPHWVETGSLSIGRERGWVMPLEDGRVVVGRGETEPRSAWRSVEVWDPSTERWSNGDALVDGMGSFTGVRGLVFDHGTGDWRPVDKLAAPFHPGEALLPDGTVVEVAPKRGEIEPTEDRVITVSPASGAAGSSLLLRRARVRPVLVVLSDGRILVTGGFTFICEVGDHDGYHGVHLCELVDLGRGMVEEAGQTVHARYNHAAAELPDGRVILVGGRHRGTPQRTVEIATVVKR
jgi:hypothetical protein